MVQGKKQLNSKPKFAEVVIGDNEEKEMRESANAYEVISHTNKEKYVIFNITSVPLKRDDY